MESEINPKFIAGARGVVDTPKQQVPPGCDGPPHLIWFVLGHVAVFVCVAVRALQVSPSPQQVLTCGMLGVGAFVLTLLIRRKLRVAQSMAEIVAPVLVRLRRWQRDWHPALVMRTQPNELKRSYDKER
jgi:hypothetical protein